MSSNADDREEARAKKGETKTNKKAQEELANDEEPASKQLDRDQLERLREKLQRKYH